MPVADVRPFQRDSDHSVDACPDAVWLGAEVERSSRRFEGGRVELGDGAVCVGDDDVVAIHGERDRSPVVGSTAGLGCQQFRRRDVPEADLTVGADHRDGASVGPVGTPKGHHAVDPKVGQRAALHIQEVEGCRGRLLETVYRGARWPSWG